MALFNPRERQAFCDIYKCKCAYCGTLIKHYNVELDHIIPQIFDEKNLTRLIEKFSLPKEFNINGYENILPSCGACNKKKGVSTDIRTATSLAEAQKNAGKVLERVNKFNIQHQLDKYSECTIPFELQFRDKVRKGPINKGQITTLEDEPIKFLNDDEKYLVLTKGKKEIIVTNVKEYRKAISDDYYAASTYSMKSEANFKVMHSILCSLETAKIPSQCFFSNNNFLLSDVKQLDSSIIQGFNFKGIFSGYTEELQPLMKLIKNKQVKVIDRDNYNVLHLEIEESKGIVIREYLRADFTNSGLEEILCNVYQYYIGGTLGISWMIILKKKSPYALATAMYYGY